MTWHSTVSPEKSLVLLVRNYNNAFYGFMIKGNARKKMRYTEFI